MQAIAEIFNSVFGVGQARETLKELDRAYLEKVRRVERDQDEVSRVGNYTDCRAFQKKH